jgi:tungstate transport system substrate-binding protein
VLFDHAKKEERFVAEGFGVNFDVIYNDFMLVGPTTDPAGLNGGHDVVALRRDKIGSAEAPG